LSGEDLSAKYSARTMAGSLGLAAISYPFWLLLFHRSVTRGLPAWLAPLWLTMAFAVPFAGFVCALRLSSPELENQPRVRSARRFAYLVITAPTVFTFMGVLNFMAGMPLSDLLLWAVLWIALLGAALLAPEGRGRDPWSTLARWRIAHGISAAVLVLFVSFHLFNHLMGLIGPDVHKSVMAAGRTVYRNDFVQPLLVAAFLFQVASGFRLAWHWSGERADGFRVFQIASGLYLLFFVVGHMNSVFIYARSYMKIDTNWMFAVGGPAGIIADPWNIRLLPHYWLGVFLVLGHLAAGMRIVMLSHGVARAPANTIFFSVVAGAFALATAILLGMCGVRL
jgi:hypothetical protein